MLRYDIKLNDDSLKQEEIVWKEGYLSPNLSYFSAVIDPSYHTEKYDKIRVSNNYDDIEGVADIETENVVRQGYIVVSGKSYNVISGSITDYSVERNGKTIDYKCLYINGKYFYYDNETSSYTISNFPHLNNDGELVYDDYTVISSNDEEVKIDTIYWIEDGFVNIDDSKYYYDKDEMLSDDESSSLSYSGNGILKYFEDGEALAASSITKCDSIILRPYEVSKYNEISKIKLTSKDEVEDKFDRICFCKYYYYVKYKNHYCKVGKKSNGDYICEIPKYILSGTVTEYIDNNELEVEEFQLKVFNSEYDDSTMGSLNVDKAINVSDSNSAETQVYKINDLKNIKSFIVVDNAIVYVDYTIVNANDGNEIAVYLSSDRTSIDVGDRITFREMYNTNHESLVYNLSKYGGKDNDDYFVVFNGGKRRLIKNACDKVIINENEYDIEYINGKEVDKDCLVLINDEKVPFKIKSIDDGDYSNGELQRYGMIISGVSSSAITATYPIKAYDGIDVNGKIYIVYERDGEKYASLGVNEEYSFIVREKNGSSMLVCEPDINATDFTIDFNTFMSSLICQSVVEGQSQIGLYKKNKIFGDKEITKELAFLVTDEPKSSDDYYNLFNNIRIYSRGGYIHIPFNLTMNTASNIIQDNIVEHDFYEYQKKKAINEIVDMEKDVYTPKYFDGIYKGSKTKFKPISEIRVNLHFRTRNLSNWKVNDKNNNMYQSSIDNWFITDFHPYKDIVDKGNKASKELMEVSDLMGLMYFTNDDIFYQKSKVSKSFLRFSIYDSTDPQTQSLLDTACVFIDGHKLFKRFIDNSRKNVNDYGIVNSNLFTTELDDVTSGNVATKVSVMTEYMGTHKDYNKHKKYEGQINGITSIEDLFPISAMTSDSNRISSRLVINSKHKTSTSSEGFYYYIFREYQENLKPKPIYMKIEFNHAGIGKTIPFLIPMAWSGATSDNSINDSKTNKMVPDHALNIGVENDLEILKEGIPLSYVQAQTYIPLYAVYDFINKEYAYVFDRRYVDDPTDGILNLNLFEMKVKDETDTSDELQKQIVNHKQPKAVVNVNSWKEDKRQFNEEIGNKEDRVILE